MAQMNNAGAFDYGSGCGWLPEGWQIEEIFGW